MGNSDTAENEERRETRECQQPVEDVSTIWSQVDECQASKEELEKGDNKRTTLLVNVGEDFGPHTVLGQSLEGSGGSKGAGVGDTHDRNQDHGVEDGWKDLDTGKLDGNDERRATTGSTLTMVQRAVSGDNEADEEQVHNVEDADTPDDLLGGLGDFLLWVFSLGSSESSKFSSAESEGSRDEDSAESMEAIEEGAVRVVPGRMC